MKNGDRVTYVPKSGKREYGIIKRMAVTEAFVVYNCAGNWKEYEKYTAALTPVKDLREGWV